MHVLRRMVPYLSGLPRSEAPGRPVHQLETSDHKTGTLSAEPRPESFQPMEGNILAALEGGYVVKLRRGVRRMAVLRYLLGKLFWEESLGLDEYVILFELFASLESDRDPCFQKKYRDSLAAVHELLLEIRDERTFPLQVEWLVERETIRRDNLVIPSQRSFFGMKGQKGLRSSYRLVLQRHVIPQRAKPKSFIGVGYRDKGTLRNPAVDGSPSWQEVSRYNAHKERLEEEEAYRREASWVLSPEGSRPGEVRNR